MANSLPPSRNSVYPPNSLTHGNQHTYEGGFIERGENNKRRNYLSRHTRRSSNKNWRNKSNNNYKIKYSSSNRKSNFANSQKQYAGDKTLACEQNGINSHETYLQFLPENILTLIFGYLDPKSLEAIALSSQRFNRILSEDKVRSKKRSQGCKLLEELPTEILVHVFSYVSRTGLGRLAQVSNWFVHILKAAVSDLH